MSTSAKDERVVAAKVAPDKRTRAVIKATSRVATTTTVGPSSKQRATRRVDATPTTRDE